MPDPPMPSMSREPDEDRDVIVHLRAGEWTVWLGQDLRATLDGKEKAKAFGRTLAEKARRSLWLHDGDYPPTRLWSPED